MFALDATSNSSDEVKPDDADVDKSTDAASHSVANMQGWLGLAGNHQSAVVRVKRMNKRHRMMRQAGGGQSCLDRLHLSPYVDPIGRVPSRSILSKSSSILDFLVAFAMKPVVLKPDALLIQGCSGNVIATPTTEGHGA